MKNKILEILDSEVLPINDKDNELTAQRICDLFDVSKQRELLIAFSKWKEEKGYNPIYDHKGLVEEFENK